ncbi:MAG: hypothetical protein NTW85_02545 [Methylococcales bacterium]|nr:hypothetical protein [Methylococcales bacterium]
MRIFWALLALCVPVVIIYAQFFGNPLIFDDLTFFQGEEFSLYLHKVFSFNLRWLPYATFVWTRQVFGDALIWLRLGNLLLHLATSVTLFFFLRRLFEFVIPIEVNDKTLSSFWLAFFGALIFALHPVSVYAVGYLVQRTTLMATLFTLLTWRLFLEGLIRENRLWLTASALSYFLAVLSKEHAIMTPTVTVALLLLISPQPQQRIKLVWSTFVLYALIAAFAVFQRQSEHILGQAYEPVASELLSRLSEELNPSLVFPLSILTQSFVFFKYLWIWLIPSPSLMSIDTCQTFALRLWSFPEVLGLVGFFIYPFLAVRLLLQRGLKGLLGFGLLCPWLLFFTELATVRIQEIFVLYRSYLWMTGLFASLPFLCQKLTAKQTVITLTCVACLLIPLTLLRLDTFSHQFKLWGDAKNRIKDDKSCPVMDRILNNTGRELMRQGRYPEALEDLNRSLKGIKLQLKPMVSVLGANYYNRGFAYLKTGQFRLAINDFNIISEPVPTAWVDLYFYKAQAFEGLHELSAARESYEKACLNGVNEGCDKQKELEKSIK